MDQPKKEKVESSPVLEEKEKNLTEKVRENPWVLSTMVLGVVLVVLLFASFANGGITGGAIGTASKTDVETKVIDFVKSQVDGNVSIVKTEKESGLYKVTINLDGKEIPLYLTLDGQNLVQGVTPISVVMNQSQNTQQTATTEVPKSSKPVVEAFVFSYCPYGLQFEKVLSPVYDLLKTKADINVVFIGAMHDSSGCSGAACFEKTESLRQISILKLYGKDKLFAYLNEFNTNADIGVCRGDSACLNKYLPAIYTKLGIVQSKVDSYMASGAEKFYNDDMARASELGIGGSPTFVINGVQSQVSRTPDAIKTAVCSAFSTSPTECSQTLSTSAASAGFGASTTGAASTGTQCN